MHATHTTGHPHLRNEILRDNRDQQRRRHLVVVNIDDGLCYMCEETKRSAVFAPCGHGGLCLSCVRGLAYEAAPPSFRPNCPQCRQPIASAIEKRTVEATEVISFDGRRRHLEWLLVGLRIRCL